MRDGCRGGLASVCLTMLMLSCLVISTEFYFSYIASLSDLTRNHLSTLRANWFLPQELNSNTVFQEDANQTISFDIGTQLLKATDVPMTAIGHPYIIENSDVCKYSPNLQFIVVVHSATENFDKRDAIRDTWANVHLYHNSTMKVIFLLGKPQRKSTQLLIEIEQLHHKDIVQGDFNDTYHNLTLKAVLGLRWVSENCRQAQAVVKVDDDVFVNIFKVFEIVLLQKHRDDRRIICVAWEAGITPIARHGKWKSDEFSNLKYYPVNYCGGFFMIIPGGLVTELFEAAKRTPFFWIDDVYFTGMLTHQIGNVTFSDLKEFTFSTEIAVKCFTRAEACSHIAVLVEDFTLFEIVWLGLLSQQRQLVSRYVDTRLLELWMNVFMKTPVILKSSHSTCPAISCSACVFIVIVLIIFLYYLAKRNTLYNRYNTITSFASIIRV